MQKPPAKPKTEIKFRCLLVRRLSGCPRFIISPCHNLNPLLPPSKPRPHSCLSSHGMDPMPPRRATPFTRSSPSAQAGARQTSDFPSLPPPHTSHLPPLPPFLCRGKGREFLHCHGHVSHPTSPPHLYRTVCPHAARPHITAPSPQPSTTAPSTSEGNPVSSGSF